MTPSPSEIDINTLSPKEITCDQLTKNWDIYQLKKGHRFSTDDIFTAYFAAQHHPTPQTLLDLGAGIGTVGLLTLSRFPKAQLTMIEAQQISHELAKRTIDHNGIQERVDAIRGDIRDVNICAQTFDLITGSPPYFPTDKAVPSPHPQRAACRMELRGSITDYAKAAQIRLKEDGVFVVCFPTKDPRGPQSLKEANLHCLLRQDVIFRADLPPTISIFVAQKNTCITQYPPPITIRDHQGQWTENYNRIRNFQPLL
jgi:tRNA1Val (adenine37-N6)-methyltransferase